MKTFYGILAALAVAAFLVYLVRLHLQMRQDAERKRARKAFLERESARDLRACLSAARSLDTSAAPREAYEIPSSTAPDRPGRDRPGETPAQGLQRRRRAATSTAFDPDLPAR